MYTEIRPGPPSYLTRKGWASDVAGDARLAFSIGAFFALGHASASAQVVPFTGFGLVQTTSTALSEALNSRHDAQSARNVIPVSGATGVPDDIGAIYVTEPADGTFTMQGAGAPFSIGPALPVPSPAPTALPTDNPPSALFQVTVPNLSSQVTYTVTYTPKASTGPCGSFESGGTVGNFTTQ
jgi:hypothetical protein